MSDLFDGYAEACRASGAWDEVLTADGAVREASAPLHAALTGTAVRDLRARADALAPSRRTSARSATGGEERARPLDVVPRVVAAQEWAVVEAGVAQRVRAVEALLADVHGPVRAVEDGVVPRRVVTSSARFRRAAAGVEPPNGVRVHAAAVDLVRDESGALRVLGGDAGAPSGVGDVLAHRSAMAGAVPEAFEDQRVRPVSSYPRRLLAALRAAAPVGVEDPTVVVLTSGAGDGDRAEHALLARSMGVELVEDRDLVCRSGRVHLRTTAGLRPVHVVHRRVGDDALDPVGLPGAAAAGSGAGAVRGCPGLLTAARAGNATIANAVGSGVADDPLLRSYLPDLVRYYLGEEPVLDDVPTWRLEEPAAREEVLDRLAELVVTRVAGSGPGGSGGPGAVVGPAAGRADLDALRAQLRADPRGWVARPLLAVSTAPVLVGERLVPRPVGLRTFAVNDGSRVWVLPGGLTRVALEPAELIVDGGLDGGLDGAGGARGAGKDTWVLAEGAPDGALVPRARATRAPRPLAPPLDPGPGLAPDDDRHQPLQQPAPRAPGEGGAGC